jgi:hypothetical protein
MKRERLFKNLQMLNWIVLLALASASNCLMKQDFTLGIILGGLMIIANFNLLQHTIYGAFSPDGVMQTRKMSIIAKHYLRLAVLGILIYVLITGQWVHPVGLTIGLSIVVISIIALGIHMSYKASTGETI